MLVIPKYGKINLADNVVFTPPVAATGGLTGVRYPGNLAGVVLGSSVSQAASEDFTCAFLIDTPNPGTSNGGVFRTSTGADNFVILASTSGQSYPWIRLAGSNVLQPSSGPKTPSYRPFLGVVSVRSGKSVEFALDGVVVHRATTAVNTGAGSFSTLGQQSAENCGAFSAIAYWSRYIDPVALSRDIMLPQHSGTQFLFGVSAGGEPSASLVGSTGTSTAGSVAPSISASISGVSATSAVGSVSPSTGATASLSGTASTASVGSLSQSVTVAATGVQVSTASGVSTVGMSKDLTGNPSTASVGTLSPSVGATATLSGTATTTTTGSLAATLSITLGGVSTTASVGTLTLPGSYSAALNANQATASIGSIAPSVSNAIGGVQSATAVGASSSAGVSRSVTGNSSSANAGALAATLSVTVAGTSTSTAVGALSVPGSYSAELGSSAVSSLVGSLTTSVSVGVSGTLATTSVGTLTRTTAVIGSQTNTAVGALTVSVTNAVTGRSVIASSGSPLVAGGSFSASLYGNILATSSGLLTVLGAIPGPGESVNLYSRLATTKTLSSRIPQ